MIPLDILKAARERLADPARWLHGHGDDGDAQDADGSDVLAQSPRAVRWNIYGAVAADAGWSASTPTPGDEALRFIAQALALEAPPGRAWWAVAWWDDAPERTHAEVLAAIDGGIRLAETEAGEGGQVVSDPAEVSVSQVCSKAHSDAPEEA